MNRSSVSSCGTVRWFGIVLLAALPACGGGGSYGNSGGNPGNPTPPSPSPTGGSPDVIVSVVGDNGTMSFSPDPVVISAGQKIAWRNGDSMIHTATGIAQGGFDTREIAPGATSNALAFAAAGDFAYRCNIHPTMLGTVMVR
jgi:plastocyanin